jgi:hypothetical protein
MTTGINPWAIVGMVFLGIVGIYITARLIFKAFWESKADYLKKYKTRRDEHESNSPE